MTIKVLLADDHPIVRSGIRTELAQHADIEIVGEAVNGDEVLRLATALGPDVVLLDIYMPGRKAVQILRDLQIRLPHTRVLILTAYGDPENILGMLRAGATGYLLKDEDPSVIVQGIRAVAQGRNWLGAQVSMTLAAQVVSDIARPAASALTDREASVLRLLARGCDNAEIADALSISEVTVKNHVTNLYAKLGVESRAAAVAWAWQHGLTAS